MNDRHSPQESWKGGGGVSQTQGQGHKIDHILKETPTTDKMPTDDSSKNIYIIMKVNEIKNEKKSEFKKIDFTNSNILTNI